MQNSTAVSMQVILRYTAQSSACALIHCLTNQKQRLDVCAQAPSNNALCLRNGREVGSLTYTFDLPL